MLRPRNRVPADKVNLRGQFGLQRLDDRCFDRSHIRHDAAGLERDGDFIGNGGHRAHRHAQDDKIAALHAFGEVCKNFVGQIERFHFLAHVARHIGTDDFGRQVLLLDRARERRSDQAEADNGDLLEHHNIFLL